MKNYLILITIFIPTLLLGQDFSKEFGKITLHEAKMKSYPKDPESDAVILFDIGETRFVRDADGGFNLEFERITKIKIFKESGFKHGTIEIPYYHEGYEPEKVEIKCASTHNLKPKDVIEKTDLNAGDIFTEKLTKNWSVVKFTMPNLQEGSVIEYKYTIRSPYLFHYQDWKFQHQIPIKYSLYIARMVPFYSYTYLLQGSKSFDHFDSYLDKGLPRRFGAIDYHDFIYEFGMENVPAFKDESFITSIEDYILKLDFQLTTFTRTDGIEVNYLSTWPELSKNLLKHDNFGKYIGVASKKSSDITEKIISESEDNKELIENLCDFVKSNYTWNGWHNIYATKKVKEFMTEKTGSCSDINLFLLGMLQNTNIIAKPVIISTRDHGKIKSKFPFTQAFNYVVVLVEVDENQILLDATDPLLPYYLIPSDCLNDKGFVLDKKEPYWVYLQENPISYKVISFQLKPDPEKDSLFISSSSTMSLYDANKYRSMFKNNQEKLIEYIEDKNITLTGEPKTRNYFEKNAPFSFGYNGLSNLEHIGEKIYVSPFLNEPISENPFSSAERKYPIDLIYAKKRQFKSFIDIPEGYTVDYLPENKKISNAIFDLDYTTEMMNNGKNISISATYVFKKAVYEPKEYKLIRYYFLEIIEKLNDKVSFVKE
jgi:hypothetical protein